MPLVLLLGACNGRTVSNPAGATSTSEDLGTEDTEDSEDAAPDDLPPPESGTWEGLLEYCPSETSSIDSHFIPCGSDERWPLTGVASQPVDGCTAVWVVVNGTLIYDLHGCGEPGPGPWEPQKVLVADALIDVRACEPSDCGGTPSCDPASLHCSNYGGCVGLAQDCPEGERCIAAQRHEHDIKAPDGRCVVMSLSPLLVGEPCMVWQWGQPNVDECDHGLQCVPLVDGDPVGVCRAFCDPEMMEGPVCNGNCAPCNPSGYHGGLCFEDCPECEAVPYC